MPKTRTDVFDRVQVDYMLRGTTRVTWALKPRFVELAPYVFQLQVSRTGGEDWEDVGTSQEDIYYALDTESRLYGQDRRLLYRVKLTTADDVEHFSGTAEVYGKLTNRQWLLAREIIRQLSLDSRGLESFEGFLFRRRVDGQRCTHCLDELTGGIKDSSCEICRGTGYVDGYFISSPLVMYDLSPLMRESHNREGRGTNTPQVVVAKFVGLPLVHNGDIWVNSLGDQRYYVHRVDHISELNGVPLASQAELRPAEFSDVAYQLELP